jgi:tape measure domain-containing protein
VAKDVTLLIKLNDQASGNIGKITASTKRLERAANGATNSIQRTNSGIRRTGQVSKTAAIGVNKLGKAVRGLVLGFGAFKAGKFIVFNTAKLEKQTKSLEVLTGSLGNARTIVAELQQFGAVTPFSSSELIESAKRLKAFGVETESVVDVTKRLADVAGATGADLGGITTAFGQIQAKGRLQGEELLQLQERGVNLQDQLRKQYGMTADEFQKALEQGRFGADAVRFALVELTEEGGRYAGGAIAQSETLSGKFSTLIDNVERLATRIGQKLQPILDFVLDTSVAIVDAINKALAGPDYATATARLTTVVDQINKAQTNIKNLEAAGVTLTTPGIQIRDVDGNVLPGSTVSPLAREQGLLTKLQTERKFLEGRIAELKKSFMKVEKPTKTKPGDPPTLRNPRGGGGGGGRTGQTPEERAAENAKRQRAAVAKLLVQKKQEAQLIAATTDEEREQLQLKFDKLNLAAQFPALNEKELQALRDQFDVNFGLTLQDKERIEAAKLLEEQNRKQLEQYKEMANVIEDGIKGAIMGAIDGSKSLSASLAGILRQLGGILLSRGIGSFKSAGGRGGSGLLGMFANGGRPPVGRPSIVGERGPELFVPDRAGTIVPNGAMGGANVTVNVDASSSSVEGNSDQAAQLGRMLGAAVQAELIKQKRPGGLLAI